ncbi:hypothetical protein NP590_03150 [Methylomonas sp. SURF-2]|uniref:Uncharacterized protein n=1 Tax=Methylomonas subterranea TaxID=2952225 RepID=A0ABT1TC99_9GAMM|nr:hypothetical protein [Methylomonas sp. SURF-2]MCQ8103094.1 hypothetical protein [Methylomonas sp. SURF-2]
MMTLDAALVIILAEALGVLLLFCAGWLFFSRKKRNKEMRAIESFIGQYTDQNSFKNQPLHQLLSETCGLDQEMVEQTLKDVSDCERALMQHIIKLFLRREISLLHQIDKRINDLSTPYCELLTNMQATSTNSTHSSSPAQGLERINQQLIQQLDTAMQTIDEITAEYTRVFSGNQTALELENSRKKMLKIFQDTERNILHPDAND